MTHSENWLVQSLTSRRELIVYVDFKSPYAYLAIEPTRELAAELGIQIDWRPLVLDIPSFLGSARLGRSGQVVAQQRSAEQWSGVKYAYFDCRRYANLRGLTVRGTVKIWDTNLAAVGMLWAKRQGDAVLDRYVDGIYEPFWKRELDVEDIAVIRQVLSQAGAQLSGFDDYAARQGLEDNQALQQAAFAAGIFGVPTYVVAGETYFGREHLPRVGWHLAGEPGPAPDIAYPVPADAAGTAHDMPPAALDVCIDFASPLSYLSLAPVLAFAEETGAVLNWHAIAFSPIKPPLPAADEDRGAQHRRLRAELRERDIARYAPHPLRDIYPEFDCGFAIMGLLWLKGVAPQVVDDFVQGVFRRYWRDHERIDSLAAVAQVIAGLGQSPDAFRDFAASAGAAEAAAAQQEVRARGVTGTPTILLDDEPYLGRQHLPLIKRRLLASSDRI